MLDHAVGADTGVALGDEGPVHPVVVEVPDLETRDQLVHEIDLLDELLGRVRVEALVLGQVGHRDVRMPLALLDLDRAGQGLLQILDLGLHIADGLLIAEDVGDQVAVADPFLILQLLLEELDLLGRQTRPTRVPRS